jgi:hypothetical protein
MFKLNKRNSYLCIFDYIIVQHIVPRYYSVVGQQKLLLEIVIKTAANIQPEIFNSTNSKRKILFMML